MKRLANSKSCVLTPARLESDTLRYPGLWSTAYQASSHRQQAGRRPVHRRRKPWRLRLNYHLAATSAPKWQGSHAPERGDGGDALLLYTTYDYRLCTMVICDTTCIPRTYLRVVTGMAAMPYNYILHITTGYITSCTTVFYDTPCIPRT